MSTKHPGIRKINEDERFFSLPGFRTRCWANTGIEAEPHYTLNPWGIPKSWQVTKGVGVKIAILDTGVAPNHDHLRDSFLEVVDFTGISSNASDGMGHGTFLAGRIAGKDDQTVVEALAPSAKLMIGKVLDDNGFGSAQWIVEGLKWAIQSGADIISMGFSGFVTCAPIETLLKKANDKGILTLCQAGILPSAQEVEDFPANSPDVLTIGTLAAVQDIKVPPYHDVDVWVTDHQPIAASPPNGYLKVHAPTVGLAVVSGIAALALSKHRQYGGKTQLNNLEDLKQHLNAIAMKPDDVHNKDYSYALVTSGFYNKDSTE